jgi:hypothetical protein
MFELQWPFATHYIFTPMSAIEQVTRNATHRIYNHMLMQLIATKLQFYHNNFFSTTMQLPYDYNHNVMLISFFINSSKFNT